MFPLDLVYGPRTFRAYAKNPHFRGSLKPTCQTAGQIARDAPLVARSYVELVELVSFLSVMNKRHNLYFRGQGSDWPLRPTIFRSEWVSLTGVVHQIPDDRARMRIWEELNGSIRKIVHAVCDPLPMPRRNTLQMFREAVWAVAQHYELWPTPLIDITPNLRIAASFALLGRRSSGLLYIVALPASTNSVTYDADQHVVLARLQAVCPPVARRPHYQDGFLVGRFPFESPNANEIDRNPALASDLSRRLVAKISLFDDGSFWSEDFPPMNVQSLLPLAQDDQMRTAFDAYGEQIDKAMARTCYI